MTDAYPRKAFADFIYSLSSKNQYVISHYGDTGECEWAIDLAGIDRDPIIHYMELRLRESLASALNDFNVDSGIYTVLRSMLTAMAGEVNQFYLAMNPVLQPDDGADHFTSWRDIRMLGITLAVTYWVSKPGIYITMHPTGFPDKKTLFDLTVPRESLIESGDPDNAGAAETPSQKEAPELTYVRLMPSKGSYHLRNLAELEALINASFGGLPDLVAASSSQDERIAFAANIANAIMQVDAQTPLRYGIENYCQRYIDLKPGTRGYDIYFYPIAGLQIRMTLDAMPNTPAYALDPQYELTFFGSDGEAILETTHSYTWK